MTSSRKILFISAAIPPHPESQTIRNVFLLRGLAARGWELAVVTMDAGGKDMSLLGLMPDCRILMTGASEFTKTQSRLARLPGGRWLCSIHGVWSTFFAIPDAHAGWDKQVERLVLDHATELSPDLIISSSSTYTAHLAASRLSQTLGIPYIVECGDPWTHNPIWPSNFWYRVWRNAPLEKEVLSKASALVVTTEQTALSYRRWLGEGLRTRVVPMGYSPEEFSALSSTPADPARFVYVGTASRVGRDLRPVMDGLALLARKRPLRLDVVGPCHRSFAVHAARKRYAFAHFEGRVSYQESLRHLREAGVLIVLGNPKGEQIPGKVFMCLAAGRPVLYVSQCRADETDAGWEILRKFPGTERCGLVAEEIAASGEKFIRSSSSMQAAAFARTRMPELAQYEWSAVGGRFAQVVEEVTQNLAPSQVACV